MAIACFFSGHAMSKNWIAVASAEHVRLGRSNGFMQVSHGKSAPLRSIEPCDRVVFYSPTDAFRGKDKLQSFTAIGVVKEGAPHQVDMGDGFCPVPSGCHLANGRGDTDPDASRAAGVHERQQELGLSTPLRLAEISELDTAAGLYRCSLWSWGPRFS